MEAYQSLRQWFYQFRRKYKRKNNQPLTFLPGMPEGLEQSRLSTIIKDHFGDKFISASHAHLSGWKSSGAFRLRVTTSSGNVIHIIYKNAVYQQEEIPALVDFPLIPGPPEFVMLSQAAGTLADYLPRVYLAEEVEPEKHYRYLLEDLQHDYRAIKGDADKHLVIPRMTLLHQALSDWKLPSNTAQFLQYGPSFSAALQDYARIRLEQYQQHTDQEILRTVLREWSHIASLHLEPEFFRQPQQLTHGDSNYTNIHLRKQAPLQIKLVDWEWAGFASPYADLASLTKGSQNGFEKQAFHEFCEARGDCHHPEQSASNTNERWRHFQWCVLERGMIDAAFLSAQYLNAPNRAKFHLPNAIAGSLRRVNNAYRQLVG